MPTATAIPAPRLIGIDGLRALFEVLVADGYRVIGPAGVLGRVPSEPPPPLPRARSAVEGAADRMGTLAAWRLRRVLSG